MATALDIDYEIIYPNSTYDRDGNLINDGWLEITIDVDGEWSMVSIPISHLKEALERLE